MKNQGMSSQIQSTAQNKHNLEKNVKRHLNEIIYIANWVFHFQQSPHFLQWVKRYIGKNYLNTVLASNQV